MKIELLIFDLDGTLIDSAPDIADSANTLLLENGRAAVPHERVVAGIGHGVRNLVETIYPEPLAPDNLDRLARRFSQIYEERLLERTKPMPGVIEFLDDCRYKIAIVTNKPYAQTMKIVAGLRLDRFPWVCIFGGDSFPKRKPDPFPLLEAMRVAGVTPEATLMIGDGIPDLQAARAARIRSIALANGYTPREALIREQPSMLLNSISDIRLVDY